MAVVLYAATRGRNREKLDEAKIKLLDLYPMLVLVEYMFSNATVLKSGMLC